MSNADAQNTEPNFSERYRLLQNQFVAIMMLVPNCGLPQLCQTTDTEQIFINIIHSLQAD